MRAMRLVWRTLIVALACASAAGCAQGPRADRQDPAPGLHGAAGANTSIADVAARVGRGEAVLVDVREDDEVRRGMAAPAVWMPTSKVRDGDPDWERFVGSLAKERPVYLYCESGGRSDYVAGVLRARGFDAANLGGFADWQRAGQPVRTPETLAIGQ